MRIAATLMVEGEGIALDALVFDATGREDLVPLVLDANPGLARLGPILPPGTAVKIPEAAPAADVPVIATVKLWDE